MLGLDIMEPSNDEIIDRANYQLTRAIILAAQGLGLSTMDICLSLVIEYDHGSNGASGTIRIDTKRLPLGKAKK